MIQCRNNGITVYSITMIDAFHIFSNSIKIIDDSG
uniref:Uncharacterized protein n=1 Tax=Anguilla anguilla TaxID=7936 RepID=A0A0E9WBN0_ANGAN